MIKLNHGKMTEWSNVVAWKAAVVHATVGSNPILSAKRELYEHQVRAIFLFMGKFWNYFLFK